ncbi:UDP-4-amino-4, 6-dideoxy-N-acetyl-beta-L-altrosamine transaminase [Methanocaldococcus lauensis]|uniref:UDP-4-amino-4, 6-dideoxy-N-acetyl-beta-L-altrosamine transaminase n=1 Tax=Methanocaldococcus lauensis TaxID=2546128 RepID=A0A8D6SVU1_9EURY|nr:UDP-4-amino-4,6-dideoxy-N-acetyl-beta-L-altrosamine transaminase [Methanocaldococcus lauensis]CAB3290128.1 UDP-4-amino-4, 6-dideoxy-N-acetyl-beta-L-altrosamine transaminase [Methanocaldococcus lauensis]
MIRKNFLPPFSPYIGEEEIKEVIDTLKSDWIAMGPKTLKFEELFREYIGSKFAISVSSCTAGLHLSLVALNIKDGDEVITTPYTFAATGNVIVHQRAKPVFVDIDKETYNINVEEIEKSITDKTKAIIPVHYAGHPCEMDEILKIAKDYDLYVIEDAAHALGAEYKGKKIGTLGDTTSFSFYATKNITTGEGGMVTTDREEIAEKIKILRLHGISRDAWKRYSSEGSWYYEIIECGYKYNMTDIQAAIGIHQLKKVEIMRKRREEIAKIYNDEFENISELIIPITKKHVKHAWHLYPLLLDTDKIRINRNKFIEELKKQNIGTSVHFIPLHLHPFYKRTFGYKKGDFPNAEWVYEREISLPIYPKMTDDDAIDVVNAVKKIISEYK